MSEAEKNGGDEEALLRARLARLNEALDARDAVREAQETAGAASQKASLGRALGAGLNAFAEFAGGVLVGAFIGWQADRWLGTRPWLLVLFLGLGVAAGFWNVLRLARGGAGANEQK